jgi:hypothetical protein
MKVLLQRSVPFLQVTSFLLHVAYCSTNKQYYLEMAMLLLNVVPSYFCRCILMHCKVHLAFQNALQTFPPLTHLNSFPIPPLKVSSSPAGNLLPYGRPAHWTLLPTNQAASSVLRKPKSASFGLLQDGHQPMSGVVICDDPHNRVKCFHHKWLMSFCSCWVRGCEYYNNRSVNSEFLRYFTVHCCVV